MEVIFSMVIPGYVVILELTRNINQRGDGIDLKSLYKVEQSQKEILSNNPKTVSYGKTI